MRIGMRQYLIPVGVFSFFCLFFLFETAIGRTVYNLDPHGTVRSIPNPATGGYKVLDEDSIIDVVILGDGYLYVDQEKFRQTAQSFYDSYFHPVTGVYPYTIFSKAFRVRAIFTASNSKADEARDTHYRTDVFCDEPDKCSLRPCDFGNQCWLADPGEDNEFFREQFFREIDLLKPDLNTTTYSGEINNNSGNGNVHASMASNYRNLYVILMIQANEIAQPPPARPPNLRPSGAYAATINASLCNSGTNKGGSCSSNTDCPLGTCIEKRVRTALAQVEDHEFGHAFGYLRDEYIAERGIQAPSIITPKPEDRSVFLLTNYSYTNDRDDIPWSHLAPGTQYNPNKLSPLGNLFVGGNQEVGVWHSEYTCLMNGHHNNYICDIGPDPANGVELRDNRHFCFWCEEILTIRILERTGLLARPSDPADTNAKGKVWWQYWENTLRPLHNERFDLAGRIALRNACYGAQECTDPAGCDDACNKGVLPDCLLGCDITEQFNAVYVDSGDGFSTASGTKNDPLNDILDGVSQVSQNSDRDVAAISPGSYPEPLYIDDPAILYPATCGSVTLGQ